MDWGLSVIGGLARTITIAAVCLSVGACSFPLEQQNAFSPSEISLTDPVPFLLRVDGEANPIGVGREVPRLSWRSNVDSQQAYEIEVASSFDLLDAGRADLWSSGRVTDGRSLAIGYGGAPLKSRQQGWWRVRVWETGSERPGAWSAPASFEMALLSNTDWAADWITSPLFPAAPSSAGIERWLTLTAADPHMRNPETVAQTIDRLRDVRPATYFRKAFVITRPVASARLYSTSAGYSEFYLSGQKIGDRILNPAQTDFDKRIYYDVDDLTEQLTVGEHVLGVHLGNGFFAERTAFGMPELFYGEPAAIAQLEIRYRDGSEETIVTDTSWQAHPSPILKNGVYSGEVYDVRAEVAGWNRAGRRESADWRPAAVLSAPPTLALIAAEMPPVRRVTEVKPKAILNSAPGVWTVDFGQNFTGLPTIDIAQFGLKEGQAVHLRYAEWADKDGKVGMNSGGAAPMTKQVDTYVSDGRDAAPWSPTFTWHGFRYMEVTGIDTAPPIEAITAHMTRTDLQRIGTFTSSDPLLNRVHETALWSFESNLVSVPSDCPIRERNGWTGDAHATIQMASYNFAMGPFLDKYLGDFRTTDFISPAVVPGRRTHSGKVDWAAAEVFLTWESYLHTGDLSVIERQYDSLLDYVAYVEKAMDDDRVTDPFHYYGDWCDALPEPGMARPLGRCASFSTPGDLTATALMVRVFDQMSDMARLLGHEQQAAQFEQRREAISDAFQRAYYQNDAVGYGSQTANAMAVQFGIAPPDKRKLIAAAIDRDVREKWGGHASVGALGQTWLYPALASGGYADTAFYIFKAKGPPGYSYLFDELSGTTLWEDLMSFEPGKGAEPGRSLNHPFKGGYDAWFYSGLGGINPDPDAAGYKRFFLSPNFPRGLDHVSVSLETGYGTIRSAWRREGDGIIWDVEVPPNTSAYNARSDRFNVIRPGKHRFRIGSAEGEVVRLGK